MIKIIRTESRYFTKSVKKLRELLKFVPDLDNYELVDGTGGTPKVVGYSIPYTKVSAVSLRQVFDSKLQFRLSHSGKYTFLQYNYLNRVISINFAGGHSNISIKDLHV